MIFFNRVYKKEGRINLENLTFKVNQGDFIIIYDQDEKMLELLRQLMSGVKKPDQGIIRWLNKDSFKSKLLKENLSVVFNENILLPERNIEDNLKFIMEIKGLSRSYFKTRLKRVLDLVDISTYQKYLPSKLLNHQLIRVNIAQALINYPSILILDNPTRLLDEVNSQGIFHLLRKINKLSITIVLLSSDQDLVLRNNKRVIRLNKGKVIEQRKGFYV